MSNVMSLKSLSNKVSRNGFDLSFKNAFTAKAGELLPIMCKEVIPGDKFKIRGDSFTRTQPVMSAAYVRMREYYDVYFVPYRLLWNRFPTFFTNMPDYHQAASIKDSVVVGDQHPFFTSNDIVGFSGYLSNIAKDAKNSVNFFGFKRHILSQKLLSYLNYGDFGTSGVFEYPDTVLNPFPLLAYQKICQDYFRDDQWQSSEPWRYNVDYILNTSDLHIPVSSIPFDKNTMFDLNYCNFSKDYFMGMLPKAQYGEESFVPLTKGAFNLYSVPRAVSGSTDNSFLATGETVLIDGVAVNKPFFAKTDKPSSPMIRPQWFMDSFGSSNSVSILALRQAEAMQKWREIAQSGRQDYQTQMQKHFGVTPSSHMSNHCRYLGGWSSNLDINAVVNQNLTGDNQADIQGVGTMANHGNIDFEAKEHGILMCIYHCMPLLDWSYSGVDRFNLKTNFTDYAIPEFDAIGMQQLHNAEMFFGYIDEGVSDPSDYVFNDVEMGYVPRYAEYKTSFDQIHGAFKSSLVSWVSPVTSKYVSAYMKSVKEKYGKHLFTYEFFKVNPAILDNIFGVNASADTDTDQFLVNSFFDIKCVRNLDYNGLPY